MAARNKEQAISKELAGLFDQARKDLSGALTEKVDEIWEGLEKSVKEMDEQQQSQGIKEAENAAFWQLNELYRTDLILKKLKEGGDLDHDEEFKDALRSCKEDALLYLVARSAPSKIFSYGDVAAACIRSETYRYLTIASSIKGRKTLIHDLGIERTLDELLAIRVLLFDPESDNKNDSMYVINDEAVLMLAYLHSFDYRNFARDQLKKIDSVYPHHYFELDDDAKKQVMTMWRQKACEHAVRILERDEEMTKRTAIPIDSSLVIGFLAAFHPDGDERIAYARTIADERLAAYVGCITYDEEVRKLLSSCIRDEDLLEGLPYREFGIIQPYPVGFEWENVERFCIDVLKHVENDEARERFRKTLKKAGMKVPE